ncbi:MAG TPA: CBS domain-containing protein [Myxococcales bacterium]
MRVSDVMHKEVVTCTDRAMLSDAAKLMWDHDIGFLPVVGAQSGALAGVLTDRDATIAAWSRDARLSQLEVGSAMSTGVISCKPDDHVSEAEQLMRKFQVHRLPVLTADGRLAGVISLNDLALRAARESNWWLQEDVAGTLSAIARPHSRQ